MALVTCPDCGRAVSTEAASCPHCGRPANAGYTAPHQYPLATQQPPNLPPPPYDPQPNYPITQQNYPAQPYVQQPYPQPQPQVVFVQPPPVPPMPRPMMPVQQTVVVEGHGCAKAVGIIIAFIVVVWLYLSFHDAGLFR